MYCIELCLIDVFLQTCRFYIPLLQEPKTPIWGKLSMPRNHKGESDRLVQSSEYAPQQVSYHDVVLILTPIVVRVEVDITLAEPMYFEEMVQHAHDGIGSFTYIYSFVDEVIDLARGIASQQTPNIAHFLGVRKYIGPGWRGSFG